MTKTEALNSAVFGASGVRLNDDQCEQVFRDFRLAGYAVVPLEPTDAMICASQDLMPMVGSPARLADAGARAIHNNATHRHAVNHYRAMIAAYEQEQGDG